MPHSSDPDQPKPKMRALPFTTLALALPGLACLLAAPWLWLAPPDHPLLGDPSAPLALLVSAIALLGSAGFPLVLARLAQADAQRRRGG